jgi:hypothetical protein
MKINKSLLVIHVHGAIVASQFLQGIRGQNCAVCRREQAKARSNLRRMLPSHRREMWQKTRRYAVRDETRRVHTGGGHQLVGGRGNHVGQRRLRQAGRCATTAAHQNSAVAASRWRLRRTLGRQRERARRVPEVMVGAALRCRGRVMLNNMGRRRQLGDVGGGRAGCHRRPLGGGRRGGIRSISNNYQTHCA